MVAKTAARPLAMAALGSNPDIPQKSLLDDISEGVVGTL
jgi:hypothetical protein